MKILILTGILKYNTGFFMYNFDLVIVGTFNHFTNDVLSSKFSIAKIVNYCKF